MKIFRAFQNSETNTEAGEQAVRDDMPRLLGAARGGDIDQIKDLMVYGTFPNTHSSGTVLGDAYCEAMRHGQDKAAEVIKHRAGRAITPLRNDFLHIAQRDGYPMQGRDLPDDLPELLAASRKGDTAKINELLTYGAFAGFGNTGEIMARAYCEARDNRKNGAAKLIEERAERFDGGIKVEFHEWVNRLSSRPTQSHEPDLSN
jgi:hypothetical protein